ncbi:PAS domain-containing protein [Pyxidicoccus sp. 3LFB2]
MRQHTAAEAVLAGGGETGALMRSCDWAKTALGPVELWPQSLRTSVSTCLNSRFPLFVWWGPELVMLYNDAYASILGSKHPRALGMRGREVWPEIWPIVGPMLEGVLNRGEATWSENSLLFVLRRGFVEECYFTFSYSPILAESGDIGGVFTAVYETTGQVLSERRLRTLQALPSRTSEAKTAEARAGSPRMC